MQAGWVRFGGLAGWVVALGLGCGDPGGAPVTGGSASASPARVAASASAAAAAVGEVTLAFRGAGPGRTLSLADLLARIPEQRITQFDPYYAREKTYRAVPLAAVLRAGFAGTEDLEQRDFVLRAKDGYTVPMQGAKAFEPGAFVAFEDVERPGWEPIGVQRANPAPLYLVWAEKGQQDLTTHPRPYQLASIEIARFEDVFPRVVPTKLVPTHAAWRGLTTFKQSCIHCHAMNRQGGRVGPELNVPQSIVEYRPVEQIKAYIRNPLTFRYSQMPPHPGLSDADLDDLVSYFEVMKERKFDDEAAPVAAVGSASAASSASGKPPAGPVTLPPKPSPPGADPLNTRF